MMLEQWAAGAGHRTVLVVVPFAGADTWLLDTLPLIEADHRILTVFTVQPGQAQGAEEFLRANACRVLPWQEAVQYEFDLVLTGPGNSPPDLCYDRLLASIPFRANYRRALGLTAEQQLVVTATWSGRPHLADRLVAELPPEQYRVAAIVPLSAWSTHGGFQLRTWCADALRDGLMLMPPEQDWRGTLIAANLVIGDDGAVPRYAAALGLPTMTTGDRGPADPVIESLHRHAPCLTPDRPLEDQLRAAMREDRSWQDALLPWITTRPGEAGQLLRTALYVQLALPEPARAVPCSPVPLPRPITGEPLWWESQDRPGQALFR